MKIYDVIIIGAGPAGITAGIYAKNFGLDSLIIGEEVGGLINTAYKVENYPGIFDISGKDLTKEFEKHRRYLKVPLKRERVELINKDKEGFKVFTRKNEYQTKTIVLAFGTDVKKLDIKNIEKFESKGVSYRADDSAFLYKDKTVAVVGGANAAVMSAVMFAKKAKKVYLIYRKDKLRADELWIQRVRKLKNVDVIYKANIVEVKGKSRLEKVVLDNKKELELNGVLVEVGCVPTTYLIRGLGIKTSEKGYIKVDQSQTTNIKGVFAAGDATTGSDEFRQIVSACSEAAIAVLGVFNFLKK
jgi:thioredoxin reductase (NADPH)